MTLPSRDVVRSWIIPVLVVLIGTLPWVQRYLLTPDPGHWMVDLRVYREAGVSLVTGREVYDYLTPDPQNLPFTYPPFAAMLAIPLTWLPFEVLGWAWFYSSLLVLLVTVRLAGAPLLDRPGRRRGLVWGLGALALGYTLPVADGLRFGQVNGLLILACLLDVVRPDLLRRVRLPQGVLVGLATAIKLTPGVFIVHFVVTRQWRAAAASIGTLVSVSLLALVVAPQLSWSYWADALLDSDRLGHNDGTANQSMRAVLMRLGPDGSTGTVLWLLAVFAVAGVGYAAARRAHARGESMLAFAVVAAVSVLVSPVSWTHHFHWLLPGVCWLVATGVVGRERGRVVVGGLLWLAFTLHLTWWAHWRLVSTLRFDPEQSSGNPFWTVLHNSYCLAALLMLWVLARLARESSPTAPRRSGRAGRGSRRSGSPAE